MEIISYGEPSKNGNLNNYSMAECVRMCHDFDCDEDECPNYCFDCERYACPDDDCDCHCEWDN